MSRIPYVCDKSLTRSSATNPDIASTVCSGWVVSGGVSELVSELVWKGMAVRGWIFRGMSIGSVWTLLWEKSLTISSAKVSKMASAWV